MKIISVMMILKNSFPLNPWILATVSLPVLLLSGYLLYRFSTHGCYLNQPPPGPKPWPIIGNLNLIITSLLPHRSIHELSQKYGPIMQLQLGSCPVVIGSSVEMAKQFLKINDRSFAYRPSSSVGKYFHYDYTDMLWAPYGPYFRHARKIWLTQLFNKKSIDSYEYIRVQERKCLISHLYSIANSGVNNTLVTLKHHILNFTVNNITRVVLGKKIGENDDDFESKEFKKILNEAFLLTGMMNIGDLIPWINFLDLQGYVKKIKALSIKVDEILERELDEHIMTRQDNSTPRDMLDVLIQYADDPNPELKLSRNKIKRLTQDLLGAGPETSAGTIEWAMSELLKNPEYLAKATEELDRVIGRDRWVEEKDIPNLPYIKFIIFETMRMHPIAPMLAPHFASETRKIHGYDIVEGTQVLVNIWSIGRDPSVWDAPNEFRPERFIGRDIDVKGQHFELLPFGSGRRMCPGYSLGRKLVEYGLASILHGFTWKLPNEMKPQDLNMDEDWGLTVPRKFPLVVIAQPRLPVHVYSM